MNSHFLTFTPFVNTFRSQISYPEKSNAIKWYEENNFFWYEQMNIIEP